MAPRGEAGAISRVSAAEAGGTGDAGVAAAGNAAPGPWLAGWWQWCLRCVCIITNKWLDLVAWCLTLRARRPWLCLVVTGRLRSVPVEVGRLWREDRAGLAAVARARRRRGRARGRGRGRDSNDRR